MLPYVLRRLMISCYKMMGECNAPPQKKTPRMWESITYLNPAFELGPKALEPKLKFDSNK